MSEKRVLTPTQKQGIVTMFIICVVASMIGATLWLFLPSEGGMDKALEELEAATAKRTAAIGELEIAIDELEISVEALEWEFAMDEIREPTAPAGYTVTGGGRCFVEVPECVTQSGDDWYFIGACPAEWGREVPCGEVRNGQE